jgi:tRNA threonylcarbamoyladenosine modification (KEOPS) complex  Pcc1 subunit
VTAGPPAWTARVTIARPDAASAERIARALAPEASREVPRSRATLSRPSARAIRLDVEANDTGALRAAINAYLGWVRLALAAEEVAEASRTHAAPPA